MKDFFKYSLVLAIVVGVFVLFTTPATAAGPPDHRGTPDGMTPAQEEVCNKFMGQPGPLFGLCTAYCEALDCDTEPNANDAACMQVLRAFWAAQKGYGEVKCPPCENGSVEGY